MSILRFFFALGKGEQQKCHGHVRTSAEKDESRFVLPAPHVHFTASPSNAL